MRSSDIRMPGSGRRCRMLMGLSAPVLRAWRSRGGRPSRSSAARDIRTSILRSRSGLRDIGSSSLPPWYPNKTRNARVSPTAPLTDLRVLDLTRVLAGPLCTMALGDLGAQVIKVERTGTGDETRGWGPPFDAAGESAYYLSVNRNKLSLALDLDLEADRALLLELAKAADVVVENFRPGTLERRGIVPGELLGALPRLIW